MRRGRPRHDDVLTPREWEVLSLLREGLTNEQIAARLGVSHDTAKFHVSEILGKLGVETRYEAATWQGQPRRVPAPGFAAVLLQRFGLGSPLRLGAAGALAVAAVALVALAAGLLLMDEREPVEETAGVERRTHDEALDVIIDAVLTGDAAGLGARFAGVTAREGSVIGGPVGIYEVQNLATAAWTGRLAAATRELYGVVGNPTEPFAWNQSPAPPLPRASVYEGVRDYDILLIVEEPGREAWSWRFSILGGQVVDIVIDSEPATPGPHIDLPIGSRMANLMPSPDDFATSFVILPPEELWPPPLQPATGPGLPGPANVASPTFAPDGRTGDAALDRAIDALVEEDASQLSQTFAGLAGVEELCVPRPDGFPGTCSQNRVRAPLEQWTQRLASGERSLYAVFTGSGVEVQIVLAVDAGGAAAEAWQFDLSGGRVTGLTIHQPRPLSILNPASPMAANYYWSSVESIRPNLASEYERFFVLPPRERLPQPPAGHGLSVRTGDAGVDALLALIEARDAERLAAAAANSAATPLRACSEYETVVNSGAVRAWADEILPTVFNIDSVVIVPEGYQPAAEHLIVVRTQMSPYRWGTFGLVESDGRIVAILDGDFSCQPEQMYPPAAYVVPPPADGLTDLDPGRRSGVPVIDAMLDAAYAGDAATMAGLISYGMACGVHEYAPPCPPGEAVGTEVEALPVSHCHGGYATPDDAPANLIERISGAVLYAVMEQSVGDGPEIGLLAVMTDEQGSSFELRFDDAGVASMHFGCGLAHPMWSLTGEPAFLLPPR